jgi:hypothetical protein
MLGGGSIPSSSEAARAEWLYSRNPGGAAEILGLRERDGTWVGMVAIVPRRLWIDGTEHAAAYLCDYYVHPQHRTLLPALMLQRAAKRRLEESGRVSYAIPNEASLPIFRRLGAQEVLLRYRWARPIRSRPFLVGRGAKLTSIASPLLDASGLLFDLASSCLRPDIRAEWLTGIDGRFDDLWSTLPKAGLNICDRSARYLRWRFHEEPGHQNLVLGFVERRSGRLAAYLIGEVTADKFAIRDILAAPVINRVAGLLAHGLLRIRKLGVAGAGVRITGADDLIRSLSRAGFRKRDPENVFIRGIPAPPSRNWILTSADEDV